MNWQAILAEIGSATAITSVLALIFKSIFANFLARQNDRLKLQLDFQKITHQARTTNLVERQAEKIEKIYSKIDDTVRAALEVTSLFEYSNSPSKGERYIIFAEKANDLIEYFGNNKIWISKLLTDQISSLITELRHILIDFEIFVIDNEKRMSKGSHEKWSECWERLSKTTVPAIQEKIEVEFRQLLAVD